MNSYSVTFSYPQYLVEHSMNNPEGKKTTISRYLTIIPCPIFWLQVNICNKGQATSERLSVFNNLVKHSLTLSVSFIASVRFKPLILDLRVKRSTTALPVHIQSGNILQHSKFFGDCEKE
jgi:hypothetical protein